jgi:hypothetical protein
MCSLLIIILRVTHNLLGMSRDISITYIWITERGVQYTGTRPIPEASSFVATREEPDRHAAVLAKRHVHANL